MKTKRGKVTDSEHAIWYLEPSTEKKTIKKRTCNLGPGAQKGNATTRTAKIGNATWDLEHNKQRRRISRRKRN